MHYEVQNEVKKYSTLFQIKKNKYICGGYLKYVLDFCSRRYLFLCFQKLNAKNKVTGIIGNYQIIIMCENKQNRNRSSYV